MIYFLNVFDCRVIVHQVYNFYYSPNLPYCLGGKGGELRVPNKVCWPSNVGTFSIPMLDDVSPTVGFCSMNVAGNFVFDQTFGLCPV